MSTNIFLPLIELEVARLSTEGNLEDLKFPENTGHGSTIQLSANTLKQNGRNGRLEFIKFDGIELFINSLSLRLEF